MAVNYKPSNTKAELLEIAAVNGVAVGDNMTKPQIIAALDAHNARSDAQASGATTSPPDGEKPAEGAQDGAQGAGASDTTNDTPNGEKPAEGAQDGAEGAKASDTTNDTPDGEKPTEGAPDVSGYNMFVYVGPSLPSGLLKENAVFRGTFGDVTGYLADVLEQYPQAVKLIVPSHRLGEFSAKVKKPGNVFHKYYTDIVSTMRGNKEV